MSNWHPCSSDFFVFENFSNFFYRVPLTGHDTLDKNPRK